MKYILIVLSFVFSIYSVHAENELDTISSCTIKDKEGVETKLYYSYGVRNRTPANVGSGFNWYETMRFAKMLTADGVDWRLPTEEELKAMMASKCAPIFKNTWTSTINQNNNGAVMYSAGSLLAKSPGSDRYPNGSFNYSNPGPFETLFESHSFEYSDSNEMFVKGGDFTEFRKSYKIIETILAKEKQERARRDTENAAYAKRVADEERTFQSILNSKNPQAMYLAAGTYSRNDDGSKGSAVYKAIISRFPSSPWAVKASDQLSVNITARQASQNNQNRSRQTCEAQKQTCHASCGNPTYWNGNRYVENQPWSSCQSRCDQIFCN